MPRTKGNPNKKKNIVQESQKQIYTNRTEIEKQFEWLKNAPLEEYLPRICHIAKMLKEYGIKI